MITLGNEQFSVLDKLLRNKRVGLLTNQTGTNSTLDSTVHVFTRRYTLTALYAPEHGLYGVAQAGESVGFTVDTHTGLPVFSLYGALREPSEEMLEPIDVLVFDIQDVGLRFYTYLYTMVLAMKAAAIYGKEFVVLDRPNPLGGEVVDGTLLQDEYASFVGMYPIPHRYGLTIGEFAQWVQANFMQDINLSVVPMKGWSRNMLWYDTGLSWVMPSPNLPTFASLFTYATSVIFEGTNVSEGRGTTKPFSLVGAPWIDGEVLAKKLNTSEMANQILYRPVSFQPAFSKYQGEVCSGVEIHILDYRKVSHLTIAGYKMLYTIQELWPHSFEFLKPTRGNDITTSKEPQIIERSRPFISLLTGSSDIIKKVFLANIADKIINDKALFFKEKQKFHLYP